MSFFGYLAAGAAQGVGKGIADEADFMDKRDNALAVLREKQAGELQRQRERLDDKSALALTLADMKKDGAGGKGGSFNLFREMMNADTPEKQDRLIALQRAVGGDSNGSDALAEAYGKTGRTIDMPANDDEGNAMPGPTSYTQRAQFDRQRGAQSLQRVLALAMDPAKLKSYEEGAAQGLRNDVTSNVTLPDALKSGDRSADAMNEALSPLNPKAGLEGDKNSLAAERNRIRQQEADQKDARGGAQLDARKQDLLIKERKSLEKAASSPLTDPAEAAPLKARMAEIDSLLQGATAPRAAAPAAGPIGKPRSPASAAAAFKAGKTY